MDRRELLKGLAAAGVFTTDLPGGILPPARHLVEHPESVIRAFNQQCVGYEHGERIGDFVIFFTGLNPHMDSACLAGQWLAWPTREKIQPIWDANQADYASGGRERYLDWLQHNCRYFVASVPGGEGEYTPGAVFSLTPQHDQFAIEKGVFTSPAGVEAVQRMVDHGRDRLLRVMRAAGVI